MSGRRKREKTETERQRDRDRDRDRDSETERDVRDLQRHAFVIEASPARLKE